MLENARQTNQTASSLVNLATSIGIVHWMLQKDPDPQETTSHQGNPLKQGYTLTPVEVDEEEEGGDNGVVTGTIFLFGILVFTIFDLGAIHSFIFEAYIKLRHASTQPLVQNLMVETPGGKKIVCDKMVENCPINIKGRNLPIILSVFKSLVYDVILAMDWLSKYYVSINCREKVVILQLPSVERVAQIINPRGG
jgi:hypothetical protein